MPSYTVEVPEGAEEVGIRVRCDDHDESEAFQPGRRSVAFHCEQCSYELQVDVHDLLDWRDTGEMC